MFSGISQANNLGKYLGVPSINGRAGKEVFKHFLDTINSKLEQWKTRNLSFDGRITLAQAALILVPCYMMQSTTLPKGLCSEIDKKVTDFIWGNENGRNKTHLIN